MRDTGFSFSPAHNVHGSTSPLERKEGENQVMKQSHR